MFLFWTVVFLLFCEATTDIIENETAILEGTKEYTHSPKDFRCFHLALSSFKLSKYYIDIQFITVPNRRADPPQKVGCRQMADDEKTHVFYPPPTGSDPMMAFYIDKLHSGIELVKTSKYSRYVGGRSPLSRSKYYCQANKRIMATFLEYWEAFNIDEVTCMKMVELITSCHIFRQMRESFTARLYEKLCLDEAGCYNVMEYYAEDLPFCVKYTAIRQFKNTTVGSWHHNIINYCHLTEMVSIAMDETFDPKILKGKEKDASNLRKMCFYLRNRLLPEVGKEIRMPDGDELEQLEDLTTAAYENGIPEIIAFWATSFVITINT